MEEFLHDYSQDVFDAYSAMNEDQKEEFRVTAAAKLDITAPPPNTDTLATLTVMLCSTAFPELEVRV